MGNAVRIVGGELEYHSPGGEDSRLIKNKPGILYDVTVYNGSASTVFLQVFNAITVPAEGTAPTCAPMAILAGQTQSLSWITGRPMRTGISICTSLTDLTKQITSTASCFFDVVYS